MAPPIFHIGYHKTATTWFQNRFYPAVSNARSVPRDRLRELLILPRALEFDPAASQAELGADDQRAIFCDEELSGNIHTGGHHGCLTADLARRLHAVDPEGQVVIFLRNQIDMIASVYRQYVRVGGNYGVGRYLRHEGIRPNRAPLFDLGHFDYHRLIACYVDLFGRDRVKVCLFGDFRRDNRSFLASYAHDLDLELDLDAIDYGADLPAYGDWSVRLARVLNAFSREEIPFKYYFAHVPRLHGWGHKVLTRLNNASFFKAASPATEYLGDRTVSEIKARFASSNAALQEELGLDLHDHGYPV